MYIVAKCVETIRQLSVDIKVCVPTSRPHGVVAIPDTNKRESSRRKRKLQLRHLNENGVETVLRNVQQPQTILYSGVAFNGDKSIKRAPESPRNRNRVGAIDDQCHGFPITVGSHAAFGLLGRWKYPRKAGWVSSGCGRFPACSTITQHAQNNINRS